MIDNVDDEAQGDNKACVLEVCELNVHRAEFNSPSDIRILSWRWFESERVPICGLQVFKMACQVIVIDLVIHELTLVCWNRVSPKELSNVLRHPVVSAGFVLNQLFMGFVKFYLDRIIMCIGDVIMIRNIRIDSTITRLRNKLLVIWVSLLISPAIC